MKTDRQKNGQKPQKITMTSDFNRKREEKKIEEKERETERER